MVVKPEHSITKMADSHVTVLNQDGTEAIAPPFQLLAKLATNHMLVIFQDELSHDLRLPEHRLPNYYFSPGL